MQTLQFRDGLLPVSRIAFGAEPLGGYEWGDVDQAEIERAVLVALDAGINLFDTADCYGNGESERRLARALGGRRHEAVIASKFGVRFDSQNKAYYDNSVAHIEQALDGSLSRLKTDCIDLYQLHWPDNRTPLEAVFDFLETQRQKGKIRAYGVTNVEPERLAPQAERPGLASFSLQYSLVHRERETAIRELCARGLAFLSYGSLGQGILSGRYAADHAWPENDRRRRPQYKNFHGDRLARNLALVERLNKVAARLNYPATSIAALRFILDNLPSSVAIVGVKSSAQIAQNALAGTGSLGEENLEMLVAEEAVS
jgi:aryl-alcohol dehydrogenase-like predicted oxidoreductase